MVGDNVSLVNQTRGVLPRIPFTQIKKEVLGSRYELSIALITPREARRVTKETKNKNKPSNVLAFPLTKTSGEILLCPETARRECKKYSMTSKTFLTYLFIHGLLHLQGLRHSATMEREESRILTRFGLRAHESR